MVNIWNPYQCMATFNLSRSASLFETGLGRGMGFRDSNQDLLGFVHMVPDRARERILDIAATQLPSGGAYHQYQPLTKRGNNAIGSGFNDDPLWLILAVAAYLKETGEHGILDEQVPFDNDPGSESTLYEHLQRSVQYTLDRLGPHGLPLIGRADWNDCLNLNCFSETPGESFQTTENREGGVAESVFIAALFTLAADELAQIAQHHGHAERCHSGTYRASEMATAVHDHGWDGQWFRRAYDYFGAPVGSATNDRRPDLHRAAGNGRHGRDRVRRRNGPGAPWIRSHHGWRRNTASCCCSRRTRATASSWARSAPAPGHPPRARQRLVSRTSLPSTWRSRMRWNAAAAEERGSTSIGTTRRPSRTSSSSCVTSAAWRSGGSRRPV